MHMLKSNISLYLWAIHTNQPSRLKGDELLRWSVISVNVNRTLRLKGTVGMLPEYKIMVAFLTEGPSRRWGSRRSWDVPALFRGSSSYSTRNQMFRNLFVPCFPLPRSFLGQTILLNWMTFKQLKESWQLFWTSAGRIAHARQLLLNTRNFAE